MKMLPPPAPSLDGMLVRHSLTHPGVGIRRKVKLLVNGNNTMTCGGLEATTYRPLKTQNTRLHKPQHWEILQRHHQRILSASFGILGRVHELKLLCSESHRYCHFRPDQSLTNSLFPSGYKSTNSLSCLI